MSDDPIEKYYKVTPGAIKRVAIIASLLVLTTFYFLYREGALSLSLVIGVLISVLVVCAIIRLCVYFAGKMARKLVQAGVPVTKDQPKGSASFYVQGFVVLGMYFLLRGSAAFLFLGLLAILAAFGVGARKHWGRKLFICLSVLGIIVIIADSMFGNSIEKVRALAASRQMSVDAAMLVFWGIRGLLSIFLISSVIYFSKENTKALFKV